MKHIVLIPARGGSKRVPGKNKKLLGSKPLIAYSIEHALNSTSVDELYVSSDDPVIGKIATDYHVNFLLRPDHLARDHTKTIDVVRHLITELHTDVPSTIFSILQPTVPFRLPNLLDATFNHLISGDYDSVTTHIPVDFYHPYKLKVPVGDYLHPFSVAEDESLDKYSLPTVLCRDGSIYTFRLSSLISNNSLLGLKQGYLLSDPEMHVNIDTHRDWLLAEAMLSIQP